MSNELASFVGSTARAKRVSIKNDCTGSPRCAAEIQIEPLSGAFGAEVHLTRAEVRWIREVLKQALRVSTDETLEQEEPGPSSVEVDIVLRSFNGVISTQRVRAFLNTQITVPLSELYSAEIIVR